MKQSSLGLSNTVKRTLEFEVSIPFRNAYFRKIVPVVLGEHDGEVDEIIEMHKPTV